MKRPYKKNKLDFEEILIDKRAKYYEQSYERLETPINQSNIIKIGLVVLLVFFILFSRIFYLSIVKGEENYLISERNRLRYVLIKAPRGIIYDRYYKPIVSNKTSFSLILLPRDFYQASEDVKEAIKPLILEIFKLEEEDLLKSIDRISAGSYEPILVKTNVSKDEARVFEARTNEGERIGFYLIEDYNRTYYDPYAFAHVVGYTGRMNEEEFEKYPQYPKADLIGKYGLEAYYEEFLHGISGRRLLEVDARLRISPELGIIEPSPGKKLVTTIDRDLQKFLFDAMNRSLEKLNLTKASAIMTNPQTGEVLAMVSLPSINVEAFSIGGPKEEIDKAIASKDKPFLNRIVSGVYAPGSTIKPLVALAALKEKLIDPLDNIIANEAIVIPNPYNPDSPAIFRDWKKHGLVDMRKAIADSCNIYFYAIGGGYKDIPGLGISRLKKYWEEFHFGKKLGIDLAYEADGLLPDPEYKKQINPDNPIWYIGDTYNVSIGQGDLLLTPLQIAYYVGAIANEGNIMKPYLVSKIIDENDKIVFEQKPKVLQKVNASKEDFKIVKEGMRMMVTDGSGQLMKTIPIDIAGKTGTPQTHSGAKTNALFAGFATVDNPEILILVLLEEPPEGSVVTIPLVDEVMRYYYNYRYVRQPESWDLSKASFYPTTTTLPEKSEKEESFKLFNENAFEGREE